MQKKQYLFSQFDSHSAIDHQARESAAAINGYDSNAILTANLDELLDYFVANYRVDVPQLDEAHIEVSQKETQIDVSHDWIRDIEDRSRPFYITGTAFTFHVPYHGDKEIFQCRPSAFTMNPPQGEVLDNELQLRYEVTTDTSREVVHQRFNTTLAQIRQHLNTLRTDFASFNDGLRNNVQAKIDARREKLLTDRGAALSFGFRVRERPDAPKTYSVPTTRRSAPIPPPQGRAEALEPALDMQVYERILEICQSMAIVLEQSPKMFAKLGEEEIRNHFLVQLNGQYQGHATGETFNADGKTDILIKVEGKNVFIAECKFWDGPKSVTEALTQLLSYSTWRDAKLALFVFVRSRGFTSVLRKMDEALSAHSAVVRKVDYDSATGFRYVMRRPDDPEREMTLTALAFAIPAS